MSTKILILSDIHSQNITLINILNIVQNLLNPPKICLIAGDITNFGSIEDMREALEVITNFDFQTFFVLGNCDPDINLEALNTSAKHIESSVEEIGSFAVVGFGSHKPQVNYKLLFELKRIKKRVCLLTHAPPYGTKADLVSFNRHGGSREITKTIEKFPNIFLVISGHIHESPTISTYKKCKIINPGPITRGNFAIIEIDEEFKVKGEIYNIYEMK
ncbi:MAG: metallophosphoesterase [Candidatus Thorarchaeota archaeon]